MAVTTNPTVIETTAPSFSSSQVPSNTGTSSTLSSSSSSTADTPYSSKSSFIIFIAIIVPVVVIIAIVVVVVIVVARRRRGRKEKDVTELSDYNLTNMDKNDTTYDLVRTPDQQDALPPKSPRITSANKSRCQINYDELVYKRELGSGVSQTMIYYVLTLMQSIYT